MSPHSGSASQRASPSLEKEPETCPVRKDLTGAVTGAVSLPGRKVDKHDRVNRHPESFGAPTTAKGSCPESPLAPLPNFGIDGGAYKPVSAFPNTRNERTSCKEC